MRHYLNGQVLSVKADDVVVAIDDDGQCHSCGLKEACTNKQITFKKSELVDIPETGDRAAICYDKLLRSSAYLYLLPLLAFFMGVFVTELLFRPLQEFWLFLGGVLLLGLTLIFLKIFSGHFKSKEYTIRLEILN